MKMPIHPLDCARQREIEAAASPKTVVVGMSGGVDSSVSAALLKEAGYRVIGLFMKSWEEKDARGVCKSASDFEDVVRTCDLLQIPYYSVNLVQEYREHVFAQFLADLKAGLTPNPDVLCNREIKFRFFLEKALELGADLLATGHYCRLDAESRLLKGSDPEKDQSYFLHAVKREVLTRVLFPVGHLCKSEVRQVARRFQLPTSEKRDSTGICFIGKRDFKTFLTPYLGYRKGELRTLAGRVVGSHDGVAYYTIGQRHGIGLGGEGEAWYVVGKDVAENALFVERGANHPALFSQELVATDLSWVFETPTLPLRCKAKIRYRQKEQSCTLFAPNREGRARVLFDAPQRAVTPGQAIVFYDDILCLGGGKISSECAYLNSRPA